MISIQGNYGDLAKLAEHISALSKPQFIGQLMGELVEESIRFIDDEFANSEDPNGNAWAPAKKPRNPLLLRSFRLYKSFRNKRSALIRTSIGSAGFTLRSNVPYAHFHQYGTRFMPARPILPSGTVPLKWQIGYGIIIENRIHQAMRMAA